MKTATVKKFGGTAAATKERVETTIDIVRSASGPVCILPSAPGARFAGDMKMTDLAIAAYQKSQQGESPHQELTEIEDRFSDLVRGSPCPFDLISEFARMRDALAEPTRDRFVSRPEAIYGKYLALRLGFEFFDAEQVVPIGNEGKFPADVSRRIRHALKDAGDRVLVTAFYGHLPGGGVRLLPRGGSDLSAAVVADALRSPVCEFWKDVPGFLRADPAIVPDAGTIDVMSYEEGRELTYSGKLLHDEVAQILNAGGIPIHIRYLDDPGHPGTRFLPEHDVPERPKGTLVGIAGKRGITGITVKEPGMDDEVGFLHTVLGVYKRHGLSVQNAPGDIDAVSVLADGRALAPVFDAVIADLNALGNRKRVTVEVTRGLAIICTVGTELVRDPSCVQRFYGALARVGVSSRTQSQSLLQRTMTITVSEEQYESATRAIYNEFSR